jgi:hypothetical protein
MRLRPQMLAKAERSLLRAERARRAQLGSELRAAEASQHAAEDQLQHTQTAAAEAAARSKEHAAAELEKVTAELTAHEEVRVWPTHMCT